MSASPAPFTADRRDGELENTALRPGYERTRSAARFPERRERDHDRAIFLTGLLVSTRTTGRASLNSGMGSKPVVRSSAFLSHPRGPSRAVCAGRLRGFLPPPFACRRSNLSRPFRRPGSLFPVSRIAFQPLQQSVRCLSETFHLRPFCLCSRLSCTCWTGTNRAEGNKEMSDNRMENSDMSSVEFTQYALRNHVAPASLGSVKARLRHAARRLGWSHNRVRDAWYADPRISISADEIRKIEEKTGLRYGREELRTNQDLIEAATALMAGIDPDFHSPFAAAIRALASALHRP